MFLNFTVLFFLYLTFQLLKQIRIKNNAINLINNEELSHRYIYIRKKIKQDTLKTFNKVNFLNNLLKNYKSSIDGLIFLLKRLYINFMFNINYCC